MTQAGPMFNRQPAHVLMLDISKPFNHDMLNNLHQSLTDFFSLVTHINGPCRVPLFGMTVVGQYPETIFPLQHIKGNFARLYSVMTEFKRSAMDTTMPTFEPDSFTQGLNDIISQFQRQQQTIRQVTHSPCQLEISILSCQPVRFISEQVNKLAETINLDVLKKVQVLSVTMENDQNVINSQSISPDNDSNDSASNVISGMVDIIPIENDNLSFMNFFKTWLKDCGTDRESIHIILPSKLNNSPEFLETDCNTQTNVLKCDLDETFINPSNLLCSEYFPMFVRPTCCWKLDWEELESNQQDFNALCKILHEKNLSLVVKSDPEDNGQTVPHAFYLIMSSSKSTLLIKAIAVEELMLPSNLPSLAEKTSQESTEIIEESLDKLPVQDVFNPYLVKSDLFKFFVSKSLKNNPTGRGSKRKFQAPQKTQEHDSSSRPLESRAQNVVRQPGKKSLFQSPRSSSGVLGTRNTPRRGRTLPAVAVLEPNPIKLYD